MLDIVKYGWLHNDCTKETTGVVGSVSQYQAPTAVHIEITAKTTESNIILYKFFQYFNHQNSKNSERIPK